MEISNTNKTFGAERADVQRLVYGISHDMGAPLRAVVQLSSMLKERLGNRLDEREGYWLQLIEDSGLHAQKMIESLSIYSRLSTNRQQNRQFKLKKVFEKVLLKLDAEIQQSSAKITIDGEWPEYNGCEDQWLMMVTCLIQNALLYQPKDVGHVPLITVSCSQITENLRIIIEDNGIGVRENLWSVLTTPFKRLQSDSEYPGIGMGLTYCERIAVLHCGTLEIGQSSLGGMAVSYIEKMESI